MRRSFVSVVAGLAVCGFGSIALAGDAAFVAAGLSGANELPTRDTRARGTAVFRLSDDGSSLTYRLIVANIDNVVAAHIHLGGPDVNGPVVAFLYGPAAPGTGGVHGVLATGSLTADDLIGPLAGEPLSALVASIEAGETYVNVHTNDGVPPTDSGAGDFPGGEIRAQIG